jgi:Tol biopolymer transport system component
LLIADWRLKNWYTVQVIKAMALTSGAKLGPYEILSPLGAGGMGEVYRARDTRLGRDVALKVLPAGVADDPSRGARFEQEARSASALNHPNIIAVYDLGAGDGVAYIVTELVEGESLRALFNRGPVAVRKLLDIGVQLADGLATAHAAGIIHRDLKPENIMLTREGRVKILDFGLAKQTGPVTPPDGRTATLEQTQPGTILGTVSYMSPEQARGATLDFHSDQFSFGLILYEGACGKRAFQKAESVQTLSAIITEDPPPLDAKLPGPLRWAIDRCLAKEPRERYDSTRDLYYELRSLRDHLSESFSTDSGATAPAPRVRRKWLLIAAGLLAAALAGFVLAQLIPRQQGVDIAQERFAPLGTDTSIANFPAWSPDGKSFAFTGVVNGEREVFVRSLGSSMSTQITRAPAGAVAFWSPDSSRVFYYKNYDSSDTSLWSVAVAGGEPELVMKGFVTAALSPDGKTLALLRTEAGVTSLWTSSPLGAAPRKYAPAPFEKIQLFSLPEMGFSPDGSKILIATDREEFNPVWSPVAQQFAYVTDRNGPQEIWLKSVQGGWSRPLVTPDQFSDPTVNLWGPAFSPEGSRIAYVRIDHDNGMWIWISSTGGGAPVRLTHETAAVSEGPADWSPDGNWLAYNRYERGNPELVKFRVGSPDAPVVLKKEAGDFVPAWSPTGDWITFLSANGDVLLVSPDGKNERRLGPLKTDYLLWSRDGKTLYGIRPNKDQHEILFSLDLASGRQKDIADLGTEFDPRGSLQPGNRYSLAPDGKSFALSIRKYRSDLWMLEGFNSRRGWLWK